MFSGKGFARCFLAALVAFHTVLPRQYVWALPPANPSTKTISKVLPKLKLAAACGLLLIFTPPSDSVQNPQMSNHTEIAEAKRDRISVSAAKDLIAEADSLKVDDFLGDSLNDPTEAQMQKFRQKWIPIVRANEKAKVIPSADAYLSWWTQNETEILKARSQYPKEMTLQQMFLWTSTLQMATDHPVEVFAHWVSENAKNANLKASPDSDGFFSSMLGLLQGIVIGALAAGPISALLLLAIEPKFREFRVRWARFWEKTWGYFGKAKPVEKPPVPIAELSREQLRQIKRARDELKSLGYTATPENLLALEVFMKHQWELTHKQWLQFFTGVERDGRNVEWDAKYFRPSQFAERVAAALARAELYVQGFTQVRRELLQDLPEKAVLIKKETEALSAAIHEYRFQEQRDPAKADQAKTLIQEIKKHLLQLGAEQEQVDRLAQNRHFIYIEKRRAVYEMVMHLKHLYEFREFTQGLPSEVYRESLQLRSGLGLDDFHREYSDQVRAMATGFGYHLDMVIQEAEAQLGAG